MPPEELPAKKSETLTSNSREPPGLKLKISTVAKRATNRNKVVTQEQSYFLVRIFLMEIFQVKIFHRALSIHASRNLSRFTRSSLSSESPPSQ